MNYIVKAEGYETMCGYKVIWDDHDFYYLKDLGCGCSHTDFENGEPIIICPFDKPSCKFNPDLKTKIHWEHKGLSTKYCHCKLIKSKDYKYETSIQKYLGEKHIRYASDKYELYKKYGPSVYYCMCTDMDKETGKLIKTYEARRCMDWGQHGCEQEICCITGKKRNIDLVNIYGDVKYRTDLGMLTEHEVIIKSIKLLDHRTTRECAERKLKEYEKMSQEMWGWLHGRGKSQIKPYKFYIKERPGRDLDDDLADIKAGIEVLHDSDLNKKATAIKKEKRAKAKEKRLLKKQKAKMPEPVIKQEFEQLSLLG